MNRLSIGLMCFVLLTISTACKLSKNTTTEKLNPGTDNLMEVVNQWKVLSHDFEPNKEVHGTWLKAGVRSKYAIAKKYMSIDRLASIYGVPVFLQGPHQGEINFNSTTAFGYYNPAFIAKVEADVKTILANPFLRGLVKEAYLTYFQEMAVTYRDAYLYLKEEPGEMKRMSNRYLQQLSQKGGTTDGSMQETFREYADHTSSGDANWYEAVTAPSFWLRRSIDGTSTQLFGLLNMIIKDMERS